MFLEMPHVVMKTVEAIGPNIGGEGRARKRPDDMVPQPHKRIVRHVHAPNDACAVRAMSCPSMCTW